MGEVTIPSPTIESRLDTFRPYAPSIVDGLTDWVRRLPIPSWLFYVAVAVVSLLLIASFKWLDGSYPVSIVTWQLILSAATFPYALAMLHYLDNSAKEALDDFRPAMQIDEAQFRKLEYQFTTLPARPALIAAGIGALYGVTFPLYASPEEIERMGFFTSLPTAIFGVFELALGYASAGLLLYHSVRQLRMVSRTYTTHARIDLFNLAPVHALSRLAARTAIGIAIITYAWAFVNFEGGEVQAGASSIFEAVISSIILVIIFIWPLLGARRLLREAKAKARTEAQQQFKATVAELHRRREAGDFGEMAGINEALDGLMKEQSVLEKISTWPWQPETLRGVGTAILLPIAVWAITRLLERFWVF